MPPPGQRPLLFSRAVSGLLFRMTAPHVPRIHWNITEQDALDLTTNLSFVNRRLDAAVRTSGVRFVSPLGPFTPPDSASPCAPGPARVRSPASSQARCSVDQAAKLLNAVLGERQEISSCRVYSFSQHRLHQVLELGLLSPSAYRLFGDVECLRQFRAEHAADEQRSGLHLLGMEAMGKATVERNNVAGPICPRISARRRIRRCRGPTTGIAASAINIP